MTRQSPPKARKSRPPATAPPTKRQYPRKTADFVRRKLVGFNRRDVLPTSVYQWAALVVSGMGPAAAAQQCGLAADIHQARHVVDRLREKPAVIALLEAERLKREREDPHILTRRERQALWSRMALDTKLKPRDRLRASELLGKSFADFVSVRLAKVVVDHTGTPEEQLQLVQSIVARVTERLKAERERKVIDVTAPNPVTL